MEAKRQKSTVPVDCFTTPNPSQCSSSRGTFSKKQPNTRILPVRSPVLAGKSENRVEKAQSEGHTWVSWELRALVPTWALWDHHRALKDPWACFRASGVLVQGAEVIERQPPPKERSLPDFFLPSQHFSK